MSDRRPWHHAAIQQYGLTLGRDLVQAGQPLPPRPAVVPWQEREHPSVDLECLSCGRTVRVFDPEQVASVLCPGRPGAPCEGELIVPEN